MTEPLPPMPELDPVARDVLERFGLDPADLERFRARLAAGEATAASNRIRGRVEPPTGGDVIALAAVGSAERARLTALGNAAIARGEVGAVVLAGGMATRFGGVVKAVVEALPGHTFLDLKLRDVTLAAKHANGRVPMWLMTSFATDAEITALARARTTDLVPVETFAQFAALRLAPDGAVFRENDGTASPYAPGHGDLTFALRRRGVLARFRAQGGRVLFMSNVDNLAATLDPAVIGAHLDAAAGITVEVAAKEPGDKGGAPARVDGRPQIVESFRFPEGFDEDAIPVFNTNTLVLDAPAIDRDFPLTFFAVKKKVEGRDAIQFERLVGELTAFLPTRFLRVERDGPDGRFQPAKDPEELAKRRPSLELLLRARGVL